MNIKGHAAFWLAVYIILILLYGNAFFESYLYSIYFVSILFPVVIGTAYFFNFYLVPKYLLARQRGKFLLYFIYMLIVSAHVQIIMIYLAFIYLANYKVQVMHPSILDVSNLSMTLYAIVFGHGFLILFKKFQVAESQVENLEGEKKKLDVGYLIVRSDRQNKKVKHAEMLFVESLSDYVKIHLKDQESQPILSKAKISQIEQELPGSFLRIHRSFIVNLSHVSSFSSDELIVNDKPLPISRSYRAEFKRVLTSLK